jgi:hypothetical protein
MFIILWFGTLKLVYPRHFLLKCLYQVRMVSGHVWVCYEYRFRLFLRFSYWILEVFLFLSSFLSEAQKSTYRQMNSSLQRRGLFASYKDKYLDDSMMQSDLSEFGTIPIVCFTHTLVPLSYLYFLLFSGMS